MKSTRHRLVVSVISGLLFLLVAVVFAPCTRNDFINYDDPVYVTTNVHVTQGLNWHGIWWAFSSGQAGNWHPLTWLSHMLDCQIFGLRAWGHHLTSVLLHAANAVLVFLILCGMTGALWRSLFVAALFGLHPLRVQSVAWVAERKDLLCMLFWMLTLWAYSCFARSQGQSAPQAHNSDNRESNGRSTSKAPDSFSELSRLRPATAYGLSLLFFCFGLLSKPMIVTLPFVLLLLDYWPLKRWASPRHELTDGRPEQVAALTFWRLVKEKVPFLALTVACATVTYFVQSRAGSVKTLAQFPLPLRLENGLVAYYRYLVKFFWPGQLAVFYPHPGTWPAFDLLMAGGVLLGISGLAFALRRTHPYLAVGWLWFFGALVPVIGIVQAGSQAIADRYTYIPLVGLCLAVAWVTYEPVRRVPFHRLLLAGAALGVLINCAAMTRREIGYWADSETLFRRALAVTTNNALAHLNLGVALGEKGRPEALDEYQAAFRLAPGDPDIEFSLGVALIGLGHPQEAISYLRDGVSQRPDDSEGHFHYARALERTGQLDEAIAQYETALSLNPDLADAHCNLGIVFCRQNRFDEALYQFQEVIRLDPRSAEAHDNLGIAFLDCGRLTEAISEFNTALALTPAHVEARNHLGLIFLKQGRFDEAAHEFQEALKVRPSYVEALVNLSASYYRRGLIDQAVAELREAVRQDPQNTRVQESLKTLLKEQQNKGASH